MNCKVDTQLSLKNWYGGNFLAIQKIVGAATSRF